MLPNARSLMHGARREALESAWLQPFFGLASGGFFWKYLRMPETMDSAILS